MTTSPQAPIGSVLEYLRHHQTGLSTAGGWLSLFSALATFYVSYSNLDGRFCGNRPATSR